MDIIQYIENKMVQLYNLRDMKWHNTMTQQILQDNKKGENW